MQLRIRFPGIGHGNIKSEISTGSSNAGSEVREAQNSQSSSRGEALEAPTSLIELKASVRLQLYTYGTSLVANNNDLTGDGDQSPVKDPKAHQVYQDLFRTGKISNCDFLNRGLL